jgi:hypothetical protein
LEDEHFEVRGIFADRVISLVDVAKALDDIIITVGNKELVPEGLEKFIESRRVDICIVVPIPSFSIVFEEEGSDMGVLRGGKVGKIDVLLYAKGPIVDIAKGCIGAVKHWRSGDFEVGHWGVDLSGLVGLVGL